MTENVALAEPTDKANCRADCGANDPHTERLRIALQRTLDYGAEPYLARTSAVCIGSVRKQVEGSQRMSGPVIRAALLLHSPDEMAELISLWLGLPLRHQP
jgi:hypothetical protein